jgi:hypothetical protein
MDVVRRQRVGELCDALDAQKRVIAQVVADEHRRVPEALSEGIVGDARDDGHE